MIKIILLLTTLLLTSCSSNSEMTKDFGNKKIILMNPITNKYYLVEHNIFDNYWIEPLVNTEVYKLITNINETKED